MITNKLLKWRINNHTYSAHLHTNSLNLGRARKYVNVRIDDTNYIIPFTFYYPDTEHELIHLTTYDSGLKNIWFVEDIIPSVRITWTMHYDPDPYPVHTHYYVTYLDITINTSINNDIILQSKGDGTNWITRLTLPAGSTNVNVRETQGWGTTDCRIKIGNWISNFIAETGTNLKTISIPQAQWGI